LGPTAGKTVDPSGVLTDAESGLITEIRPDPTNAHAVFLATAGGGVWRTSDITAPRPSWTPLTDSLASLAVGALTIDAWTGTMFLGTGNPHGDEVGGFIQQSADGGKTWASPVRLADASGRSPRNVRSIAVDPTDATLVLAATDLGLFRSTDGGTGFALVDLPNGGPRLAEATWSIAYVGYDWGGTEWLVSGVAACAEGVVPPEGSAGSAPGPSCAKGNPGDIWHSTNGGESWTSATETGILPHVVRSTGEAVRPGRMTIGTGSTDDPNNVVAYVLVANEDETNSETVDVFRTTDRGRTYTSIKGAVTNPDGICFDTNVGDVQSGYNQALAVDPTDDNHLVIAGLYCSLRSLDGRSQSPTWQVVSDVYGGVGNGSTKATTACGSIPYVHSDFHSARVANIDGQTRVLLGGDGGLVDSVNAFDVPDGSECNVTWENKNYGLVTELCYSIGSGDPAEGDGDVVFTGMQDLSSRWRTSGGSFDTINLSDGTGSAVARGDGHTLYWAAQAAGGSVPNRTFCERGGTDCSLLSSWKPSNPRLPPGDGDPFATYFSAIEPEVAGGVLSHSTYNVWKADSTPAWKRISGRHCDLAGACTTGSFAPHSITNIAASPTIAGLYGIVLDTGFAVTSDGGDQWTLSNVPGVGPGPSEQLWYGMTQMAFPPSVPAGKQPGDVYLIVSATDTMADGSDVPPTATDPRRIGRILITEDRGKTFRSLFGRGLPNVRLWTVKYDRTDATGQTLFVGTDAGLYWTTDGGASWRLVGVGLPRARVTDLYQARDGSFVRVSTWGRGVWQLDAP
jgi:hypothetical protein